MMIQSKIIAAILAAVVVVGVAVTVVVKVVVVDDNKDTATPAEQPAPTTMKEERGLRRAPVENSPAKEF